MTASTERLLSGGQWRAGEGGGVLTPVAVLSTVHRRLGPADAMTFIPTGSGS